MREIILQASHLHAGYTRGDVLQNVNFKIFRGEILATVGRNGVGKSTLMKTVMGLLPTRSGSVLFRNEEITGWPPRWRARQGIGYVPQGREIFPELSVAENLLIGEHVGLDRPDRRLRYELVFEYFPILKERLDQPGGTLSGGQQQMLALGRALIGNPELMLLDEPSVGIQPSVVQLIGKSLLRLNQEEELTIFLVEQNIALIEAVAQRAYTMDKGRLVSEFDREQIRNRESLTKYLAM